MVKHCNGPTMVQYYCQSYKDTQVQRRGRTTFKLYCRTSTQVRPYNSTPTGAVRHRNGSTQAKLYNSTSVPSYIRAVIHRSTGTTADTTSAATTTSPRRTTRSRRTHSTTRPRSTNSTVAMMVNQHSGDAAMLRLSLTCVWAQRCPPCFALLASGRMAMAKE